VEHVAISKASTGRGAFDARPDENLAVTFPRPSDNVGVSVRTTNFHELYERYAGDVYRFAYWLSGNHHDASDLTSETFARVWTAATEPRTESVKAYLFTIARNLHRKQWRLAARQDELDEMMPDTAAAPDAAAVRNDELERTFAALQQLPELDRTLLLLRAEEDLSYDDIAAATGLSSAAARVRVFRARAALLNLLKTETGESK
jgi:RNA polymerase sigma-70 factor (ECF subfamily)